MQHVYNITLHTRLVTTTTTASVIILPLTTTHTIKVVKTVVYQNR